MRKSNFAIFVLVMLFVFATIVACTPVAGEQIDETVTEVTEIVLDETVVTETTDPSCDVEETTDPVEVVAEPTTESVDTTEETTEPQNEDAQIEESDSTEETIPVETPTEDTEYEEEESDSWVYDDALSAEENIFIYLTDYLGYSDAAACGILGNIAYETGWKFNPHAGSESYCYGLIQWLGGRLNNLKRWCNENGRDYTTIQGQLDFMDWELQNADPYGTYDYLLECEDSADGAYDAGWYFCYWYERPAYKESGSRARGGEAMKYYEMFA